MNRASYVLLILALAVQQAGSAESSRPHVVQGSASFNQNGANWTIDTHKNKTIINWHHFGVPGGSTTTFNQPRPTSSVLNRVTGPLASGIYGSLISNGKVFLINPNGIVVGKQGVVNTRGFVASTLDVDDQQFLRAGTMRFSGDHEAAVVNLGRITASGDDILLIGPRVENHGTLKAERGKAVLAAGHEVALSRNNRVFILPSEKHVGGTGVLNTGTIEAVRTELQACGNMYALAINNEGTVNATGVVRQNGRILLCAEGGTIRNTGALIAYTVKKNGKTVGGEIQILGETLILEGDAVLDASGDLGGGHINVGGSFQGKGPLPNAQQVWVGDRVTIKANALNVGDGGTVILWADHATWFYGNIEAKGGPAGGDGGFAEVSGKQFLKYKGHADLTAPLGALGTLLLDPTDGSIVDGVGDGDGDASNTMFSGNPSGTPGVVLPGDTGPTMIYESELEGMAATADVIIQMTNNLTVEDLADDLLDLSLSSGSLTLIADADGDNAGAFQFADPNDVIRTEGGSVSISAAKISSLGGIDTTGASGTQAGGDITLTATSGGISINQSLVSGGLVTLNSADGASGIRTITGNGLLLLGSGSFNLITSVDTLATGDLGGGSVNLINNKTLTVGSLGGNNGITATGGISLTNTTGSGIVLDQAIDAGAESLDLRWNGTLTQNAGGTFSAGTLNLQGDAGTSLALDVSGVDAVGTTGPGISGSGTVELTSSGGLTTNTFNANSNTLVVSCAGWSAGRVTADALLLKGTGDFALNANINTLAADVNGGLAVNNQGALSVQTVSGTSGIKTNGNNVVLITGDALNVDAAIDAGIANVALDVASNGATQGAGGSISGGGLALSGSGNFFLDKAGNFVPVLAANVSGGDLVVLSGGNITVDNVAGLIGITAADAALLSLTAPNGYVELLASIQANGSGTGTATITGDVRPENSLRDLILSGSGDVELTGQPEEIVVPPTVIPPTITPAPSDDGGTSDPGTSDEGDGGEGGDDSGDTTAGTGGPAAGLGQLNNLGMESLGFGSEWELKLPKELVKVKLTLDKIFNQGFEDPILPVASGELSNSQKAILLADEAVAGASPIYHALPDGDPLREKLGGLILELKRGRLHVRGAVGLLEHFLRRLYLEKRRDRMNQDAFMGALEGLRGANERLALGTPMLIACMRTIRKTDGTIARATMEEVNAAAAKARSSALKEVKIARKRLDRSYHDVLLFDWEK